MGYANSIELIVKVINVKYNKDAEIFSKSKVLRDYSILIDRIENYLSSSLDKHTAIETAINECIAEGILKDFLTEHGAIPKCLIELFPSILSTGLRKVMMVDI